MAFERHWHGYSVSDDPGRIDLDVVHGFLTGAYWSRGISRACVAAALRNSLNFGLYANTGDQVGYARSVTDRTTYAYLGDVFVLADYRGAGLGKFLVGAIMAHPGHQGLRRMMLATRDAQELYRAAGFAEAVSDRYVYMHKVDPDIYRRPA